MTLFHLASSQLAASMQASRCHPAELPSAGSPSSAHAKACARDGTGGAHLHIPSNVGVKGKDFKGSSLQKWKRGAVNYIHSNSIDLRNSNFWSSVRDLNQVPWSNSVVAGNFRVAASSSDFKQQGPGMPSRKRSLKKAIPPRLGYHPLEDIPAPEKGKGLIPGEGQLSSAEIARTIAEVNVDCIVFASVVRDESSVLGTDANYLVDHNGDLYLEMDDGDEFLQNLQNDQTCSILIGFGKMDDVSLSELIEEVDEGDEESPDGPDSSEDGDTITEEHIKLLNETFPGGLSEIMETLSPEAMGSLGAWGGPDSLKWVHPWEFAVRLAESATTDYGREMDFPTRRLTISGVVRRATPEEEHRIRDLWDDRFSDLESDSDNEFYESDDGESIFVDDPQETAAKANGSVAKGVVRAGVWMGEPIKPRAKDASSRKVDETLKEVETQSGSTQSDLSNNGAVREGISTSLDGLRSKEVTGAGGVNGFQVEGLEEILGLAKDEVEVDPSPAVSSATAEAEILDRSGDEVGQDGAEGGGTGLGKGSPAGSQGVWEAPVVDIDSSGEEGTITWSLTSRDGSVTLEGTGPNVLEAFMEAGIGELGEGAIIEIPPGSGWGGEGDWEEGAEEEDGGASLYKVEILSIQLDSTSGIQESVEVAAWSAARPDMLAHAASGIIERANSLDRARQCMAELCDREHGLTVDEVSMVGIDHLGIDLRVRMGIELRTLRFPFLHPATSERAAEKLLDELLRPRQAQARRASKRTRQSKRLRGRFQR